MGLDFAGVSDPLGSQFSSFGDIITKLLPFIFTFAAMLALLFLIWGGIRYMMARGDPKAIDAARGTITSAIIGLLIVLLVAAIFSIIGAVFKIEIFTRLLSPRPVYADVNIGSNVNLGGATIDVFSNIGELFTRVVKAALAIAGLVFFAMVVWGGLRYLNAGGDPKAVEAARNALVSAGIGLLIVVVSFVIIEAATRLANVGSIF